LLQLIALISSKTILLMYRIHFHQSFNYSYRVSTIKSMCKHCEVLVLKRQTCTISRLRKAEAEH